MPELPEVETVRRTLEPRLVGRRIVAVRVGDFPGVFGPASPEEMNTRVGGRVIVAVRRRAKYLLLELDDGAALMTHLRMTGSLEFAPAGTPPLRFERCAIVLDDGSEVRFCDQRKFGRVVALTAGEARQLERRFGPEPLSRHFTAAWLHGALARRRGKLKSVLLDQEFLAGLGNIYVDEALFRARLHPERSGADLTADEVRRLHRAIRTVLREAIERRGTTFSSYRDAEGNAGENQANLRVYGRGGRGGCPRCGCPLERIVVGGRGTSCCPRCQPRDPRSPRLRRVSQRGEGATGVTPSATDEQPGD